MAVKKETTKAAPSLKKRVAAKKTNAKENAEVIDRFLIEHKNFEGISFLEDSL